jgi:predicted  nucleic acid-binding Zn-ribbon protein
MASWEEGARAVTAKLKTTAKVEAKLDQDMADLVEYVKWISGESQKLRERVRASERVISDLKSSGESSVESLMETLYLLKVK